MEPRDFIALARHLLQQGATRPSQVSLRRALSTAYYALFHALARNGADLLVGKTTDARSRHAWRQVYRGLEHGQAKQACKNERILRKFPSGIQNFGRIFVIMQEQRHTADYDPNARFTKSYVTSRINGAENAIKNLDSTDAKDRRAFVVYVLFKLRES